MDKSFLLLVLLLNLFFLCQLGSAFQSRSSSQVVPGTFSTNGAGLPGNRHRGSIYDRNMPYYFYGRDCDTDGGLPCPEVVALKTLITNLGLNPAPSNITRGFCDEHRYLGSITINCTCNGSVCHITEINMDNAGLTGVIDGDVAELAYLKTLNMKLNSLSGWIPPSLGNLSSLQYLRLDDNELYGKLPSELGKLSKLEEFWVTSNRLIGKLPKEYENLKNLESLHCSDLSFNSLTGGIPYSFQNLSSFKMRVEGLAANKTAHFSVILEVFEMAPTFFMVDIQKAAGDVAEYLKFYKNFCGNLEDIVWKPPNESSRTRVTVTKSKNKTGNLMGNDFDGGFPPEIFNMTSLEYLWVSDLKKPGLNFPESANLSNVYQVILRDCSIMGEIPGYIGNWSGLRHLTNIYMDERCPDKKFHSLYINAGGEETTIDKRHYDADHNTSLFYVSPNHWAYSCSGDFLSSSSNYSDYIKNMTCGVASVDAPLYEKARLCPQALTYYGFCLQNGKYKVTLHFAETVYAKDEDHSSSGKRVFDIYIQGNQVRKDYNIKERAGGPNKICNEYFNATVSDHTLEIRLFWAGKGSMYNPPSLNGPLISAISVTPDFKVGGLPFAIIVVITVAAIFIPLLLLAFMWTMGWVGHKEWQETRVQLRDKSYTVKQVVDATHNFSSDMEIGRGQFGRVYKAVLPDQTVAVKKLSPQSKQVIDQIGREVYTLKTVKHHNLVEFLDSYSKRGLHLLIYEYMENSSLAFALFDSKSNLLLDWNTRFNICLAIAEALKYLHEDSRLKIVHRNIKPSNILLDKELNAKVSDFGLAKIYEDENLNVAIGAGDTLVYMAPEYATVKVITEKADVYSYGIVLLEIVSGKRDADFKSDQETVYLIDKACLLHSKGKLVNLIDEKLHTYNRDQALTILDIAILCIDRSPSRRPTMSGVCDIGFKRGAYIVGIGCRLPLMFQVYFRILWGNELSGQIPPELGDLSNLQTLYLVENKLSGELPPQLGNLTNLRRLSVTSNNLTGKLPRQYEQLTNLLAFGVGGNNLSGPIDPFIAKWVNLTALNSSLQRNLERKDFNIKENAGGPHTPLVENFTAINVHDNLLVIGLFWAGKGSLYNPPNFNGPIISAISVKPEFRVGGLSSAKIAGITVGAIFISTSFTDFHVENGLAGTKRVSRSETLELRGKTYTAKQVIDATRNFSHKLEIGNGRFGIVYKAELPDQTVAVKRLSSQSKQVIDQIGREVYTLKTVKHQNLLEFLDVYTKKDLHMLIYELKFQLGTQLDTRFYICLGIARGLKYLHEDSRLKIIHRNIKPSNILLDGELNAKVSAFGLAKLYEGENLNVVIGAGDTLAIDDNELTGELPPELGNLSNLKRFWATSNSFNGTLSERYANLKSTSGDIVIIDLHRFNNRGQPPLLIHSVARGQASAFGDSMDLQLGDGDPSSGSPSLDNGSLSASNSIVELGDSSVMERPSSSLSDRDPRISICL
ncbi:hypothetical protein LWI29_008299 [Acer saccharum]|uniref:non-specific serine/threonine protein kinase n=1 Tax=Acer saccharum TaxID=4024 RepID=A0AA39SUJ0_ACESA|nr:hypothetical protein LWI29_008299 [Acer saccharum]